MKKSVVVTMGLTAGLFLLTTSAHATVANQKLYKETFPNAKNVTCKVCHTGAVGKKDTLNDYGKQVQGLKGKDGKITVDALKKLGEPKAEGAAPAEKK